MAFLADQNVPRPTVIRLRDAGLDVAWIGEIAPGASDRQVLAQAASQGRVIITFDTDLGELVYRHDEPAAAGVVLLRFSPSSPLEPATVLLKIVEDASVALVGHFTVVARDHIRQRPMPKRLV